MATTREAERSKDKILSRKEVESLVSDGRKVIIVENRVLKVDAWLPYHPGGDKAILHMVGRDATNEVKAFHAVETQKMMLRYQIGRVEGRWKDFVPPIQGGVFQKEQAQASNAALKWASVEDEEGSSGTPSSEEPSPVFEPAEKSTIRRRRQSTGASSRSSATSLDTLALDEPTKHNNLSSGAERTQKEIQHDLDVFPSLDEDTQRNIIRKYQELDERLHNEGYYDCNYTAYAREAARYIALGVLSFICLKQGWYIPSALFLGLLWHQLTFTVHDAGHMGITHDFHIDSCIGIIIADYLGGLSCCWWKRNHNVHHIVTNSAEHDPDIQHMPFFAVSHRFFESLKSSYYDRIMTYDAVAKFTLKYQHYLYYPILTFGRFNLYVLSWQYVFLGQGPRKGPAAWHRWFEMAGQIFFWY